MILLTSLLLALSTVAQPAPASPVKNPEGPLTRTLSTHHRFTFSVTINYPPQEGTSRSWMMPLIVEGPWSSLQRQSFEASLSAGRDTVTVPESEALSSIGPLGQADVSISIPQVNQWPLKVEIKGTATSWSSNFNDAAAMQIPWPSSWPSAVKTMLSPSPLIESDSEVIRNALPPALSSEQIRSMPPAEAAKRIVQFVCSRMTVVEPRMSRGAQGQLRGIAVNGAEAAATTGHGSAADLTCVCVAMLRASGIPARPVIGLGGGFGRVGEFNVWAEVFLPGCGWTPFDPDLLRQQAIATLNPQRRWGEAFGTMPQLQSRIPLAWSFAPGQGDTAFDSWAIWGWSRFLPSASFPVVIQKGTVSTTNGPWHFDRKRRVPSSITLERTGTGGR